MAAAQSGGVVGGRGGGETSLAAVTWAGSVGSRSPRQEAVLRLHRLHFVEKAGNDKVKETIDLRRSENQNVEKQFARSNNDRLKQLKADLDAKLRQAVTQGSMSLRSREERANIEEARQDPGEARSKMTKELRERARVWSEEKRAMLENVRTLPVMNVRPKEDRERIEEARQDPKEAAQRIKQHVREVAMEYQKKKTEMLERVQAAPQSMSFRTKEQREKIEELRQDPNEALEKMTQHMRSLSKSYREEKKAMLERVSAMPPTNIRTKVEIDAIEDLRQDPEEAREKMTKHMRDLSQGWKAEKARIEERLQAHPPMSLRSKEESDQIEEARQDPEEARAKMTEYMRELAQTYRQQRAAIRDRVDAIPAMTFRSKEQRERMDEVRQKSLMKQRRPSPR